MSDRKLEESLRVIKQRGTIPTLSVQLLISGIPGAGKSALKYRLLDEDLQSVMISSDNTEESRLPSTPLADLGLRVSVSNLSHTSDAAHLKWSRQSSSDEKAHLLYSTLRGDSQMGYTIPRLHMEGPTDSHMQQHTRIQGSYPSRVQLPKSTQEIPLPSEILADVISENKGNLSDLETFTKHSFLLHIIDSGGQPEFMEVLPALVTLVQ